MAQLKPHDEVMAASRKVLASVDQALARRPASADRWVGLHLLQRQHLQTQATVRHACSCAGRCDGRIGCPGHAAAD